MQEVTLREDGVHRRVRTVNTDPDMTVQSDVVRADIKAILAKYRGTGIVDHLRNVDLQFRDVSELSDYADMAFQAREAEKVFMTLPSKIREVFGHDYANWLDAAHDQSKFEALRPKLEELGVVEPLPKAGAMRATDGKKRRAEDMPKPAV